MENVGPNKAICCKPYHTVTLGLVCTFSKQKDTPSFSNAQQWLFVYLQILLHGTHLRLTIKYAWRDLNVLPYKIEIFSNTLCTVQWKSPPSLTPCLIDLFGLCSNIFCAVLTMPSWFKVDCLLNLPPSLHLNNRAQNSISKGNLRPFFNT